MVCTTGQSECDTFERCQVVSGLISLQIGIIVMGHWRGTAEREEEVLTDWEVGQMRDWVYMGRDC